MTTLLALTIAVSTLGAEPKKPPVPVRSFALATVVSIDQKKQIMTAKVPVALMVPTTVTEQVEINGRIVTQARTVYKTVLRQEMRAYSVQKARFYDAAANKLTAKEVEKRFKKGVTITISKNPVETAKRHVRELKKDTLILVLN